MLGGGVLLGMVLLVFLLGLMGVVLWGLVLILLGFGVLVVVGL